jgi:hypothetical protein
MVWVSPFNENSQVLQAFGLVPLLYQTLCSSHRGKRWVKSPAGEAERAQRKFKSFPAQVGMEKKILNSHSKGTEHSFYSLK